MTMEANRYLVQMQGWKRNIEHLRELGSTLGDRYLEVRYEDLVTDPIATVVGVLDFFGREPIRRTRSRSRSSTLFAAVCASGNRILESATERRFRAGLCPRRGTAERSRLSVRLCSSRDESFRGASTWAGTGKRPGVRRRIAPASPMITKVENANCGNDRPS